MDLSLLEKKAKDYGVSSLQAETGLSRSNIYSIFNGDTSPTLRTVQLLAKQLGYQVTLVPIQKKHNFSDLNYVSWSLAYWGAPLLVEKKFDEQPSLDETLMAALKFGRKIAKINSVLPIFLSKNFSSIDWDIICDTCEDYQYLGYQLHLVANITGDTKFHSVLAKIEKLAGQLRRQNLIRGKKMSEFQKVKYQLTENKIATKWKLNTADSLDSICKRFNKWTSV